MAINSVWVFAQVQGGAPTTGTLELLTKARSLSSNVAAFVGGDVSAVAGTLGEYGATKVYATGDLAGKLPGPAVSGAMKAVIDGGDSPSVIMFPQNYEGRDVMSRLSVKLDKTVLTNNVDIASNVARFLKWVVAFLLAVWVIGTLALLGLIASRRGRRAPRI